MNRLAFIIAGGIVLLSFLPAMILGPNSYITIHDNLDGEMVYKYLLVQSGQAFHLGQDSIIPNIMNGLPRAALRSGFDLTLFYYFFLEPYAAYIANQVVVHMVAFAGMFVFLRRHVLHADEHNVVASIVALCFASVPFYTQFGLSVAGQPLLAHAFLNILEKKNGLTDFIIITIFPFYSHFFLVGPFILSALLILFGYNFICNKNFSKNYIIYLIYFFSLYCIVEINFILNIFNDTYFVSHRKEWDRWNDINLYSDFKKSFDMFFVSHYHGGKIETFYMFTTSLIAMAVSFFKKNLNIKIIFLLLIIFFICLFYGFHGYFNYLFSSWVPILKYFNISRFYFFLPFLWCVVFSMSLELIYKDIPVYPLFLSLIIFGYYSVVKCNLEIINNIKLLFNFKIDQPTYSQFISRDLFYKIHKYINKDKSSYRVVSIGIHPSIAQFNDFYTLDSYQVNYDINYKKKFRNIIECELNKNYQLKDYFDNWGNRCYIFASELGKMNSIGKNEDFVINNIDINTEALKELGGKYVFSSVKILNYSDVNLKFEGVFSDTYAFWDIYLYKVL